MTEWPLYDFLSVYPLPASTGAVIAVLILGYSGARFWIWAALALAVMYGFGAAPIWIIAVAAAALLFGVGPFRRVLLTGPSMHLMRAAGRLPRISATEQIAIEAGTVWIEGELFSGRPDFKRILGEPYPGLTDKEQAFLDGPVEELCHVVDDWKLWTTRELPHHAWDIIAREKFFGMIIPQEYGGLGFSAIANSAVVMKLSTRSSPLATTVMVPNSLGPAELLIHYGTAAQRDWYLPRLADARLIPAFALTEPNAGSDAGAITASAVVFRTNDSDVRLRVNWSKRYITLSAIAGVLGLAVKLHDPENILGRGRHPGITCLLVATDLPGVVIGRLHDPLGVPFVNAPTEGHDVIVGIDSIIGGPDGAGQGWRMLVESLAAGRGISLPASSVGSAKLVFRVASAHAASRRQFGLPIGKFEGIEEPLARIGGWTYLMEAARTFTLGAIDSGAAPAVVTAMMKYNTTELGRKIILDGMDILGGNAISRGPRNLLAHLYINNPVGITVEGANILTRTLMIFGQGAIRCHPYAYPEIKALAAGDVSAFDRAFWGHIGHVIRNGFRSALLSVSRGRLAGSPVPYVHKLKWASASFAFLADLALVSYGGELKRREKITGRFADVFSWLYLATATVRRFEAEGRRSEDRPYFRWAMEHSLERMQTAFDGLMQNLRIPVLGWFIRGPIALWSRLNRLSAGPSDHTGHVVARRMQTPSEQRSRMTEGVYVGEDTTEALARLERAFDLSAASDLVNKTVAKALGTKRPDRDALERAVGAGIITTQEAELVLRAEAARWDAIQVDAFDRDEWLRHHQTPRAIVMGDAAAAAV